MLPSKSLSTLLFYLALFSFCLFGFENYFRFLAAKGETSKLRLDLNFQKTLRHLSFRLSSFLHRNFNSEWKTLFNLYLCALFLCYKRFWIKLNLLHSIVWLNWWFLWLCGQRWSVNFRTGSGFDPMRPELSCSLQLLGEVSCVNCDRIGTEIGVAGCAKKRRKAWWVDDGVAEGLQRVVLAVWPETRV